MENQLTLKQLLARDRILVAPCCYDMISAKLIEQAGFEAVYLGGRVLVLAANPGRVQGLVDLSPLKEDNGTCRRESAAVQEMAGSLRAMLREGGA